MKKTILKQGILGAAMAVAMMGVSSVAQAETMYCVPYAFSNDEPMVATVISMNNDRDHDACDLGCKNEWSDYVESNYKNWYKMHPDLLGPFERRSDAKAKYYELKSEARDKWNQPFHHATHFRCSGN